MIVDVTISLRSFVFAQSCTKVSIGFTNVSSLAVAALILLCIHAFNKSGRHLEIFIYDVIRGKASAAVFGF